MFGLMVVGNWRKIFEEFFSGRRGFKLCFG
jgi:hypothetical protein